MVPRGALKRTDHVKSVTSTAKTSLTVSEKIIQVQHDHALQNQRQGPTIELFYHELKGKSTSGSRLFDYVFSLAVGLTFLLLYPVVALGIKLSSSGPIVLKQKSTGMGGRPFDYFVFRTGHDKNEGKTFRFGRMLTRTGLYKLPSVINLLRGDVCAVGPEVISYKDSTRWNNILGDFYKRYAVNPGFVQVAGTDQSNSPTEDMANQLSKEFEYIVNPTFSKDLDVITGRF